MLLPFGDDPFDFGFGESRVAWGVGPEPARGHVDQNSESGARERQHQQLERADEGEERMAKYVGAAAAPG